MVTAQVSGGMVFSGISDVVIAYECFVSSTYAACKFNTCRKVVNMCVAHKQHFCKGMFPDLL